MNTRLILSLSLGLLLAGCGQGYTPASDAHVPGVQGGGDVFGSAGDHTVYRTASYEVLRYTLTNTLNLGATIAPNAATVCGAGISTTTGCPKANPVGFLDSNASALGVPVYNVDDPLGTQSPSAMSSAGYKAWALSASSACGRMMVETTLYVNGHPALFPNSDVTDVSYLYQSLMGRLPTQAEIDRIHQVQGDLTTVPGARTGTPLIMAQGAVACSAVLGSLEFLTVN
jgi:hypothetical protein